MKILFTGGGTGGHIIPIIAVTREIIRQTLRGEAKFYYIGPKDDLASIMLSQEGIKVKEILAGKIRRYWGIESLFLNIVDIFIKTPLGIIQALYHIFYISPDLIFSKGGYGSLPVVLAGWIFRVPIFLHESDVAPGLANKILNKFSSAVFISFPRTEYFPFEKMILVGNPVRKEILEGSKEEAKRQFKIRGEKPVILIMGGSQGSERINELALLNLPQILNDFELIHQTGGRNFEKMKAETKVMFTLSASPARNESSSEETITTEWERKYYLTAFLKETELKHAYEICDLVVSRAGSGTIFEIAARGKPSILIPLPEAAQNHQIKNAYAYAASGAAMVMEEESLTAQFFLEKLKYLFHVHPERLRKMGEQARKFSQPNAAKVIAGYIVDYLILSSSEKI